MRHTLLIVKACNPKANIVVAPSDHLILKEEEFLAALIDGGALPSFGHTDSEAAPVRAVWNDSTFVHGSMLVDLATGFFMPIVTANSFCAIRCLYSPCTGRANLGFKSAYISFISS